MKFFRKKTVEAAMLIGMIAAVFAQGICAFAENLKGVEDSVFRLHIMANSDSDEDQELKLKVRNAVLEISPDIFDGALDSAEAEERAAENIELFKAAAEKVISDNGYDYSVSCEITKMHFDARTYGSASLPEGDYRALRISIGEGEGHNWWCVMFPPLCLPAVTNTDEVLAEAEADGALTSEEIKIIQNPSDYEVRFYIAELIKKLSDYISRSDKRSERYQ